LLSIIKDARLLFTRVGDLRKKVCFDGSAHNFP
jgi:hypothetical protein